MANIDKSYDVFLSYSIRDAAIASEVASACRESGLTVWMDTMESHPGVSYGDALWEALAESRALLMILSPAGPTSSMAIEIGAARAWNKPIYAIVTDPSSTRLSTVLPGIELFPLGRMEEVIESVKVSIQEWTDDDREFLTKLYAEMGISADHLALDPRHLAEFVKRFRKGRGKAISGERLLSELLRLRKQGKLKLARNRSTASGRGRAS